LGPAKLVICPLNMKILLVSNSIHIEGKQDIHVADISKVIEQSFKN
jgi:hypothetical protein